MFRVDGETNQNAGSFLNPLSDLGLSEAVSAVRNGLTRWLVAGLPGHTRMNRLDFKIISYMLFLMSAAFLAK